ncbi:MAG: hypothetical protein M1831_001722 [Alyxoria varia]|nr:MAG: hypothetical protein M1831_001722 [Alyxoria varia]
MAERQSPVSVSAVDLSQTNDIKTGRDGSLSQPEDALADCDESDKENKSIREEDIYDESTQAGCIRRQVDFYFSDKNLVKDNFLRQKLKTKTKTNKPVKLDVIHKFRKMQDYQPVEAVVEALRFSKVVSVFRENDQWYLQRKSPFDKEAVTGIPKQPKAKPTGFEQFFTDAPLTAEAAAEENQLYSTSKSVGERLEIALQRYSTKRKFQALAKNIFDKWLKFGGVDNGPRKYGGLDLEDMEGKTKAEKRKLSSTIEVKREELDDNGKRKWTIDFDGVAKSFLSILVPEYWGFEQEEQLESTVNILDNFYRYILLHNVCPEHTDDIEAARHTCALAKKELYATSRCTELLPGEFNVACSTVFGGYYSGMYISDQEWANKEDTNTVAQSDSKARRVLAMALALYTPGEDFSGQKDMKQPAHNEQHVVERNEEASLEVTELVPPDAKVLDFYKQFKDRLKPLGKLRCKHSEVEDDLEEEDLPPDVSTPDPNKSYEFLVDNDVLKWCFKGMKIEGTVCALSGGFQFLDKVTEVRCSFYNPLPNEIALKWSEPLYIPREDQRAREARQRAEAGEGEWDPVNDKDLAWISTG